MCIIIDTNCLAEVFDANNSRHSEFKPIIDWIYNGKGQVVYGGSKYEGEIPYKYIKLFGILRSAGKGIYVENVKVDVEELKISKIIQDKDFDDQHLVALLRISKCKLICSLDARAYPFFTNSLFFKPQANKPKIYNANQHKALLKDTNIAEICKPCSKTTNKQKAKIGQLK